MSVTWTDLASPPHLPALYAHAAAKRKINTRNYYMNRDRRDIHTDDSKEWGQGFIGTFESGYTQGAAALVTDGRIVSGCNIENASYGVTLCAECSLVSDLFMSGGGKQLGAMAEKSGAVGG